MADFTLVVCRRDEPEPSGLINIIRVLLSGIFPKRESILQTRLVNFQDRLSIAIVQLPYTLDELSGMSTQKKVKIAARVSKEAETALLYLPRFETGADKELKNDLLCPKAVNLFKACIPDIFEELYTKHGRKLRDLELVMIQGQSINELFEMIRYLSPYFKYVTAVVSDRETAAGEADSVYDEYGLPVGISTDIKGSLKGADIVISMADTPAFDKPPRHSDRTLVIDLYGGGISTKSDRGIIIRDIMVEFPAELASQLGAEILETYNINALAEAFLMKMEGFYPGQNLIGHKEFSKLYSGFRRRGFLLASVTGRHNTYSLRDLKIPAGRTNETDE